MRSKIQLSVVCVFLLLAWSGSMTMVFAADDTLQASNLRCEYLVDPLGIGETAPRLSWMLQSFDRGDGQAGYQILVASTPELLAQDKGDLWDSGKVKSDDNSQVEYAGKPLASRMRCFWKVRVWSGLAAQSAQPSQWSQPAFWTMGLLRSDDWHAKWIDSSAAAAAGAGKEELVIRKAVYGGSSTRPSTQPFDVTSALAALVKDGKLTLRVSNETMGGDPAPNTAKKLTVNYDLSGKNLTIVTSENNTLSIPDDPSRLWYLRKSFDAKAPISRATLYVTALGLYEVHINGQRVGDHTLAPDWTDYKKRVRYQAYDVSSSVKAGNNAISGLLARGWYAGHLGNGGFHQYGTTPALMAQLEITYADGSTDEIVTDPSWKTRQSPILATDFMLGESYDAREEIVNWNQPGLDETAWQSATVREEASRSMDSQVSPPVRQLGTLPPIKLTEPATGHWTFDLGQNMVGVVRLAVAAPAGTVITLHHAEMLNPDGTIYTTNLRKAPSVDTYICKGGGTEIWQPKFTFHGFRYVELTGVVRKPSINDLVGVVLGSDTPHTGMFTCSDPRINQLMSNIQWGQRGNYLSVPTDCPQRDERLGWMGDAQVFVRTATNNADVAAFFTKWLVDVDDAQHEDGAFTDVSPERGSKTGTPAWGDAGVICPWTIYLAYGDKRILQRHLPAMTRWIEWCREHSTDLIREPKKERGADYGDWLSIKADTPKDVIGTAYFAYSTHLVARAYQAVGDTANAKKYQLLFEEIKAAFNDKYVSPEGRVWGDTQCCYLMALKFDLLPENLRANAARYLVEDIADKNQHLSTGFVGVSYLLPMLSQEGYPNTAYQLLMQDTFPSWLFSVKHGATTIWERWDGWTPDKGFQDAGMNSFNHYSLGSCGEWLYDTVAGIGWDADQPGYKHIILKPTPGGGLTSAAGSIGTPCGKVYCAWTLSPHELVLNATVPPNTTATLFLPTYVGQTITESGSEVESATGVKYLRDEDRRRVYELESGSYSFTVTWK
jgi:alpha-L-rhamnosidase